MIVVDTNVMVRLVVGGADGADAARLFERETEWAAPRILMSELHNVLVGFVRRGAVTPEQAKAMSDDAAVVLADRIASVSGQQVIDVALECGLTAYDAEFVALARALGVPLATQDKAVLRGAADVAACRYGSSRASRHRNAGYFSPSNMLSAGTISMLPTSSG